MIIVYKELSKLNEKNISDLMAVLPASRKEKAMRYRFFSGKASCVVAYLLFLLCYRQYTGCNDTPEFDIADSGKPYLSNFPDLFFNLSHCDTLIACVMNKFPVGIDVQNKRNVKDSVIDKICSETEKSVILSSADSALEFCRIWSIKESITKVDGTGIFKDVKNLSNDGLFTYSCKVGNDTYLSVSGTKKADPDIIEISFEKLLFNFLQK